MNDILSRIVGAVPCALIVENYAVSGYAAAHFGTRPAQPASDSSRERASPRTTTTAARRDGRRVAVEPVWLRAATRAAKREPLIVGGLPVTCNLTLPVACTAKAASIKAGTASNDFEFEYSKYSGWPEIKESLMSEPHPGGATCSRRWSWTSPTRRFP